MQYNDIKCITARTLNLKPLHNKYRTMLEINNSWGTEGIVSVNEKWWSRGNE